MTNNLRLPPILFCLLSAMTLSLPASGMETERNVIFITLDGVRPEEFFHGTDPTIHDGEPEQLLPYFWSAMAPQGSVFGDREQGSIMVVGNPALVSLPAYQSIMVGHAQPCWNNNCGRVRKETFPERLTRELGLARQDVATIASWAPIARAVEAREGATFVNTGMQPLDDGSNDPELAILNEDQANHQPPWAPARYDRHTWAQAMRYLRVHTPRFLYISLNDADEWGHRADYPNYLQTLRQYDQWLQELDETLTNLGTYGANTCIIMTTDHGRGKSKKSWPHHGITTPNSKYVWLYGSCRDQDGADFMERAFSKRHSHLDIRPTVEALFGLRPTSCLVCGRAIKELEL